MTTLISFGQRKSHEQSVFAALFKAAVFDQIKIDIKTQSNSTSFFSNQFHLPKAKLFAYR